MAAFRLVAPPTAWSCPAAPGAAPAFSDALSAPAGEALLSSVIAQTPRGAAWRTDENADGGHASFQHRFWRAICDPLADFYAKLWKIALASTACTLSGPEDPGNDALGDWEREFGLPEPCTAGLALTVDRRKQMLRQKIADSGGQSIPFFVCLAASIGYSVAIEEPRALRCGEGRCGAGRVGGPNNEVIWIVRVASPGIQWFRLGADGGGGGGRVGRDPLGSFGRAVDLECLIAKWKPAHTQVRFHYVYTGATPYSFAPGLS